MEIWKAIVLGVVQGLTEFLPVSSSGHLIFFQRLLNVNLEAGELFLGIMLHIGTLIALIIVFFNQIIETCKSFTMIKYLIIASLPAAVLGIVFGDKIDTIFYSVRYLPICFLTTAILLYITEILAKRRQIFKPLSYKSSLVMGLMQAVAIIPGISRSGSTIAGGEFYGLQRQENANFSFLMSIPVIGGAALLEITKQFVKGPGVPSTDLTALFLGMLAAALSGLFAIKFMLKIIRKANYKWFSLYLVVLAVLSFWQ